MKVIWKTIGYMMLMVTMVVLVFSSGAFSVMLYGKITGNDWRFFANDSAAASDVAFAESSGPLPTAPIILPEPTPVPIKKSVMLDAPQIMQLPELPVGCEVTSLAMLLQYAGIQKDKMALAKEVKKDTTSLKKNSNGDIVYWGNPNNGFVGDINGKMKGFGVYHAPVFELLAKYIPSAVDMTGSSFDEIERKLSENTPVIAWTTTYYGLPRNWVEWDTPTGAVRTTFSEHAIVVVGYDDTSVYVNDPRKPSAKFKVDKKTFIDTWVAMGQQAISYTK
ncbi:C39 family peptidase [Gorillibacterium massiliense]|uniref:C39 family peptidase n=1 Tax=Gorillibacterium massiliense TaxID=1280390 RepID=UPI0004BA1811|nr:C39 family peptidase [Gorillibacterium massiliense]